MYTTYRQWYKYGREEDEIEVTVKEFDTLEKAIKYAHRYSGGRFVNCTIENEKFETVYELLEDGTIFEYEEKKEETKVINETEFTYEVNKATEKEILEDIFKVDGTMEIDLWNNPKIRIGITNFLETVKEEDTYSLKDIDTAIEDYLTRLEKDKKVNTAADRERHDCLYGDRLLFLIGENGEYIYYDTNYKVIDNLKIKRGF